MDRTTFQIVDQRITRWMAEHGLTLLRVSIGLIFLWFGAIKFWPGLSAADQLATDTIEKISFGLIGEDVARVALAILETTIGIGLILGRYIRLVLLLLLGQMMGTVTPLFLFPDITWSQVLVPTLEGQYILKNMVLVSAGLTIGATARGGGLVDDPEILEAAAEKPRATVSTG
jgi:uncharacterized membrane protein YkgB